MTRWGHGWTALGVLALLLAGCREPARDRAGTSERALSSGTTMALTLSSPAFHEGGQIPTRYTCDGSNRSPALGWSGEPAGTRSFALIVHDPDAPRGDFTHWVLFNLPAEAHALPEGVGASGAGEPGTNDFGELGYGGPCPPPGHGRHRYYFTLYALDIDRLPVHRGAKRGEVEAALRRHVLDQARLLGVFERR